jgi:hypothetical protein
MLGQARIGKPYWALISTSSSLDLDWEVGVSWLDWCGGRVLSWEWAGWQGCAAGRWKGIELGVGRIGGVLGQT